MPSDNNEKYKAPALEKGLAIIEYLALQPYAQSQSEIANGLAKSPNEIYRMLVSLEGKGYIHRDPISSKYSLSLKLYYLSRRHSFVEKLRSASLQAMKDTSIAIKEPCHLCVIYDNQVMVIAYSKSPSPIAVMIGEGNLYSISKTASGKLLLSFSDAETRMLILQSDPFFKSLSKKEQKQFMAELETIRQTGYYEMPSGYAQGIIDISLPIGNNDTGIIACLTVPKLVTLQDDSISSTDILAALRKCSSQIEANLGLST